MAEALRAWSFFASSRNGTSTFYRLYAQARDALPADGALRRSGRRVCAVRLAGQVDIRLRAGGKKRIRFAAYRLKYSRWVHVAVVDDERVDVPGAPLSSFEASRAATSRLRPKTVADGDPLEHRPGSIDYGFSIELCGTGAPSRIENLVGELLSLVDRGRRG